ALGFGLVAYLLAVHIAESGAPAGRLLRRQAKVLLAGACPLPPRAGFPLLARRRGGLRAPPRRRSWRGLRPAPRPRRRRGRGGGRLGPARTGLTVRLGRRPGAVRGNEEAPARGRALLLRG